jgi:two-component system OmpR family sensor kinase
VLSFRKRLALVHFAVIAAVLAVTAVGGYWTLSRAVHQQLDAALLALAETEAGLLAQTPDQPVRVHEVPAGPAPFSFVRLDRLVQVVDADGEVLARSANLGAARLPTPTALLARLAAGETVFETLEGFGEEPVRVVSIPVPAAGALRVVQVAGSLDDVNQVVESASLLFLAMGVALVVAVGAAGALLARRVFGAIDDVVHQARRIGESSLGERLPHPGTHDEIGRLVDTLNDMLARIGNAFEAQRRFTSDASHELRSPLSRLRTELEVTLRRPRDQGEYVQTLRSCMEEVERLTLLVEELLMLARIDAGLERGPAEAVSLSELAREVARRFHAISKEKNVRIVIEPSSPVTAKVGRGPADLVLANLIDNALKFSPAGAQVMVRIGEDDGAAVMSVADAGPGLRAGESTRLFDRFYRGSAARAANAPGLGLGLALSQAIVEAHGGRIDASNGLQGGALFEVRMPCAGADG